MRNDYDLLIARNHSSAENSEQSLKNRREFQQWLENASQNPKRLRTLASATIRHSLGDNVPFNLAKLDIPPFLKNTIMLI